MSNETINTIIDKKAYEQVDKLAKDLEQLDLKFLKVAESASKLGKNSFKVQGVKQYNNQIAESSKYLTESNALNKEAERLNNGLTRAKAKLAMSYSNEAKELAKSRYETTEINKKYREQAILSSKLAGEYKKQSIILNQLRRKFKDVALVQGENSKEARRLQTEITKLDTKLKRVDASAGQFQRSVGNYGLATKNFIGFTRQLAGAFGFVGGAMIAANVIKNATQRIIKFDQAQANLASVLGKTKSEVSDLTDEAIRLGSATVYTATQVSEFQTNLARLGFRTDEIKEMTEASLNLATALGSDLAETAELVGGSLRGMNQSFEQSQRFADVLAKTTNISALNFQRLSDALPYVTAVANSVGVSFERLNATMGVLANRGLKAETIGAGLRTSFLKLEKQGLTLEEGLDKIRNATNKNAVAAELLGIRSATLGVILADTTDEINEAEKALLNAGGTAQSMADTQIDTLSGSLKILDSNWEKFILSVEKGDGVLSNALRSSIGYLTEFIDLMSSANRSVNELNKDIENKTFTEQKKYYKELGEESSAYAEIDAKNAKDRIKTIELEIETSKIRYNELKKNSNLAKVFSPFDAAKAEEYREKIENLSTSLSTQKGILKAANSIINENTEITDENIKNVEKEVGTRRTLADVIQELADANEELKNSTKDEAPRILQTIEALEKERNHWKQNNDAKKDASDAMDGTIDKYKELIKQIEKFRDANATDTKTYRDLNQRVTDLKIAVSKLKDEYVGLSKTDLQDWSKTVVSANDGILESTQEVIDRNEEQLRKNRQKAEEEKELQLEIQQAITSSLRTIGDAYGLDLELFDSLLNEKKQSVGEWASQVGSLLTSVSDLILSNTVANIDAEIAAQDKKYDRILANENLTAGERDRIRDEQEAKRRQLERKRLQAEKDQAIFQSVIATAVAVVQALPLIPLSIAVGTLGALQTAAIASRPIPEYWRGKPESDNYEGIATVGEKRTEVIKSKDGSIRLTPSVPTLTYVGKDDIIYPSVEDFESKHAFPTQILQSVTKKGDTGGYDLNKLSNKIIEANRKSLGSAKFINTNINKSQDINHAMWKQMHINV